MRRIRATLEVNNDVIWIADSVEPIPDKVCMRGMTFPKELFIEGKRVGEVYAIDHMNTSDVYTVGALEPTDVIVHETVLNAVLEFS